VLLICFDLDNTLYDYSAAESEAEAYIAEELCKKFFKKKLKPIEVLKVYNDVKNSHMHHDLDPRKFSRELWLAETIEKLRPGQNSRLIDYYCNQYEKKYWDYLVPRIKLFPNTLSTMDSLKISGKYKLATITDSDGRKDIKMSRIKALDLEKYFDYIITTDDTSKNKPSVENWEYLLKLSGLRGEDCMMVGDHPEVDLISAKKLGFLTVWNKEHINNDQHYRFVDYEISEIGQLLAILKKLS
jgi:putative hydrolase of the HAD superfamily